MSRYKLSPHNVRPGDAVSARILIGPLLEVLVGLDLEEQCHRGLGISPPAENRVTKHRADSLSGLGTMGHPGTLPKVKAPGWLQPLWMISRPARTESPSPRHALPVAGADGVARGPPR